MSCAVLATGDGLDPLHTTMGSGPDLGLPLWELEPTEVGYDGFRMVAVNGLDPCRGRLSWRAGRTRLGGRRAHNVRKAYATTRRAGGFLKGSLLV